VGKKEQRIFVGFTEGREGRKPGAFELRSGKK